MSYRGNPQPQADGIPPNRGKQGGRPLSRRDYERMNRFNEEKVRETGTKSWAELSEPQDRFLETEPKWRQNRPKGQDRPVNSRRPKPDVTTRDVN